jgi:hypothetical protein
LKAARHRRKNDWNTQVDKLEILWPDGAKEEIKVPAIDRIVTVAEGKGVAL